jgi:hypothetical protein
MVAVIAMGIAIANNLDMVNNGLRIVDYLVSNKLFSQVGKGQGGRKAG